MLTVSVITSDLHAKMAIPDSQRYPWNIKLIKIVEDNVVFQNQKVFYSDHFSIASYKQEMHKTL